MKRAAHEWGGGKGVYTIQYTEYSEYRNGLYYISVHYRETNCVQVTKERKLCRWKTA